MRLRVLVMAAGLLWPVSSLSMDETRPPFKSGNQLYEDCTAALDSHELTFCMGYVMGLSDSLQTLHLACSPKEVSLTQLTTAIVKYLREHPGSRYDAASNVAGLVLMKAFPWK